MEACEICGRTADACTCNTVDLVGFLGDFRSPVSPARAQGAPVAPDPVWAQGTPVAPDPVWAQGTPMAPGPVAATEPPPVAPPPVKMETSDPAPGWPPPSPLASWPPPVAPPPVEMETSDPAPGWPPPSPLASWPPPPPGSWPPPAAPPSSAAIPYYPHWGQPDGALPPRRRIRRTLAVVGASVAGVLVVLGVIGAVAGNNGSGSKPPGHNKAAAVPVAESPATPAGFTAFRSDADQFSVDVPDTWKSVDPTSPGAQAAMNEIKQSNPALRSALATSALQLAEQGMALLAINPVPGSDGFASNVNIVAQPALTYSPSDLSQIAASEPSGYAKLGGTITSTSYVTLGGHRALRLTGTLPLTTPLGARIDVSQTQYYTGANGFLYIVTLSGNDPAMATIASSFSTG